MAKQIMTDEEKAQLEAEVAEAQAKHAPEAAPTGVAQKPDTPAARAARVTAAHKRSGLYLLEQHDAFAAKLDALARAFGGEIADVYKTKLAQARGAILSLETRTIVPVIAKKTGPLEVGEEVVFNALGKKRLADDCTPEELAGTYTVKILGTKKIRIADKDGMVFMVAENNLRRADPPGVAATDDLDLDILGDTPEDEAPAA